MRIESFERVVYENNPLAEVVCQIRFEKIDALTKSEFESLQTELATAGYGEYRQEISVTFTQPLVTDEASGQTHIELPQIQIHHFTSVNEEWRVSVCQEFIALTCRKYSNWNEYLQRLLAVIQTLGSSIVNAKPVRLGLRYKDVIERESLGLANVPWHELIAPFLLGPLIPGALADGQTVSESEVENLLFQSLLRLDSSMLLLQSALLTSIQNQQHAFLIDADFYNEGNLPAEMLANPGILSEKLDALHINAGALFRRGITTRLHHALNPRT